MWLCILQTTQFNLYNNCNILPRIYCHPESVVVRDLIYRKELGVAIWLEEKMKGFIIKLCFYIGSIIFPSIEK